MTSFETKVPTDTKGMERYLGSGAIKGVGPLSRCFLDDVRYLFIREERLAGVKPLYLQCLSVTRRGETDNSAQDVIPYLFFGLDFNV